jgi:hypothetical protein
VGLPGIGTDAETSLPPGFDNRTIKHAASRYDHYAIPALVSDRATVKRNENAISEFSLDFAVIVRTCTEHVMTLWC